MDYPVSEQWSTGVDADAQAVFMARDCPGTKMVLGGYSQGAAVMGFLTPTVVPDGVDPATRTRSDAMD